MYAVRKLAVSMSRTGFTGRPLSRAAVTFSGWRGPNSAGTPARRPKFGWRRRQTFPAAAEFGG